MRILIRSLVVALALGVVPVATVAAHECIVVNRSDMGDEHATGSGRWITVTLEQIYAETEDFGLPDLTAAQVTYAVNLASSWGVPDSFTFRSDKTIAEDASGWQKNGHSSDGKGIDHFVDAYGAQLFGALDAALQNA
jgi:hypothetical protein